jgi:hypothetical protein
MVWSPPWSAADEWTDPGPVLRLPGGRLLVGASVYNPTHRGSPGYSERAVLVRLKPNGSLDQSFGQDGFAEVDPDGGYLGQWAWLAEGRLASVVTRTEGGFATPETRAWWLYTFAPDSASAAPLRPTGSIQLGLDLFDNLVDLRPTRDGGLLMIGVRGPATAVRRILPDGSLDPAYGRNCAHPPLRAMSQGGAATPRGGAFVSARGLSGSLLAALGARGCVSGKPLRLRGFIAGPPLLLPGRRAVVAASYPQGIYDTDLTLIRIRR